MPTQPQLVIDLDLDIFVHPPVEFGQDSDERAPSGKHKPSPRSFVEFFYQYQLQLMRSPRTKGAIFDFHEQSYQWWRQLILAGQLKVPFEVVHIDAHDDLLSGIETTYFFEEWTATLDKMKELPPRLNSANYLGHAVSNGWLSALTWVRRTDTTAKPIPWIFKDFSSRSELLETKHFSKGGVAAAAQLLLDGRMPRNVRVDIQTPFREIQFGEYRIARPADLVFVARSPSFTPIESDANEDLIRDRIVQLPNAVRAS
jgi:hypothetical protein